MSYQSRARKLETRADQPHAHAHAQAPYWPRLELGWDLQEVMPNEVAANIPFALWGVVSLV